MADQHCGMVGESIEAPLREVAQTREMVKGSDPHFWWRHYPMNFGSAPSYTIIVPAIDATTYQTSTGEVCTGQVLWDWLYFNNSIQLTTSSNKSPTA